jgi:hypothetical protein
MNYCGSFCTCAICTTSRALGVEDRIRKATASARMEGFENCNSTRLLMRLRAAGKITSGDAVACIVAEIARRFEPD